MDFIRSGRDPLVRFLAMGAAFVVWVVWSAVRRILPQSTPPSAASFRFSEIVPDPNYPCARTIHTKIRGVSHQNPDGASRQRIIRSSCHTGDALFLVRQPGNPADPNAVMIGRACEGADGPIRGEQLGYLSRDLASDLAPVLDRGKVVMIAEILELTGDITCTEGGNVGVNIRVEVYIWPGHASPDIAAPRIVA